MVGVLSSTGVFTRVRNRVICLSSFHVYSLCEKFSVYFVVYFMLTINV